MPTYEYRCLACRHGFELFQRMSDEPGAACPECGSDSERLISGGSGFLFKGDGFYITDYRSEEYRKRAKEEAGAGAEKESAGAGTLEETAAGSGSSKESGSGSMKESGPRSSQESAAGSPKPASPASGGSASAGGDG